MISRMSRRSFAKTAFVGGLVALGAAAGAAIINMLYPRNAARDTEVLIPSERVPSPGEPPLFVAGGNFLLVHLGPDEGADGYRGPGGLLAIRQRCTHLHCEVEWRHGYAFDGEVADRLVCPCHGGVFTRAGVRLFGPPPRSLDTLALRVTALRDVVVDTAIMREGHESNPLRAVVWSPP